MSRRLPPSVAARALGLCVAVLPWTACSLTTMRAPGAPPPDHSDDSIARLWIEPDDLTRRDLYWGPGGSLRAPRADHRYRITGLDETGHSRGYDVVGPDGREWKIKVGDEAQSEIVASRVLWAVGFHQPVMHVLDSWKLDGVPAPRSELARFRLKEGYRTDGHWSWRQNPFVGTREFKGLLVAQLLLNNWDLKTSNNRIYTMKQGNEVRTWFVVQDLGAALGATRWPIGTRNAVAHFERQQFIKGWGPEGLEFDYAGRRRDLFRDIEPADVVWTCRRLAQLTDQQWLDAFRAARYADPIAMRFIAKLRSKILEGLAMIPYSGNDS